MEFLRITDMKRLLQECAFLTIGLAIFGQMAFSQAVTSEKASIRINTLASKKILQSDIQIIEPVTLKERVTFQSEKQSFTIAFRLLNPNPEAKLFLNNIEVQPTTAGDLYLKSIDLNVGSNIVSLEIRVNDKPVKEYVYSLAYIPPAKNISPNALNPGKYFALIIANESYINPTIPNLVRPVSDAKALKEVLTAQYTFDADNIYQLFNMTRDNLIMTLDEIQKKLTVEDNLLIYYAGHGRMDQESGRGYWLLSDADPVSRVDWFPNSTLADYIKAIKAKHIFLIADACFAGSIFYSRGVFDEAPPPIIDIYRNRSRTALTSGGTTEVNDESKFSELLIEHLKTNTNQYFTSSQLYSVIQNSIMTSKSTAPRFGIIQDANDMHGDFVFILRTNRNR
jgi:hypothetical protein